MKTTLILLFAISTILFFSCDETDETETVPTREITASVSGQAVIKTMQSGNDWVVVKEVFQTQKDFTKPIREISWTNRDFAEKGNYKPSEGWSLIDAVVHPSGDVSAISIQLEFMTPPEYRWNMKMTRIKNDGSKVEFQLNELATTSPDAPLYPGTLDRARLIAFGEDVYVVARGGYHVVQAHRLSFIGGQFVLNWQMVVEPSAYAGIYGIIGGGFDNFRQTERYFYVYADVDSRGDLYVGAPSSEELLMNHDEYFNDNLMSLTEPETYNFGMAVLTKVSSNGERVYSKLVGGDRYTRLLNMSVSDNKVYFVGRYKKAQEPAAWDAWIYACDITSGEKVYGNTIDIRGGDMFWDARELKTGEVIAVGTTDYTQNPGGLSVSDSRRAMAVVLNAQGKMVREIELPQGPPARGSETMFVNVLNDGSVVFSGAHNAPGTHAEVYTDGFVAVRNLQ